MIIEVTDFPVPWPDDVNEFHRYMTDMAFIHNQYSEKGLTGTIDYSIAVRTCRDAYRERVISRGYPLTGCEEKLKEILLKIYSGDYGLSVVNLDAYVCQWIEAMFTIEEVQAWMIAGIMNFATAHLLRMNDITSSHVFMAHDQPHTCTCGLKNFRQALNGRVLNGHRYACDRYRNDLVKTCIGLGQLAFN